jgi:hypothetical protein
LATFWETTPMPACVTRRPEVAALSADRRLIARSPQPPISGSC